MIIVHNGENITSTATEDEVLFVELNDNGETVPAGRNQYLFEIVSGTVQVAAGKAVDTSKATSKTTAGTKWVMTIANQGYGPNGPQEGNKTNLRIVGVGVVAVTW